ncbi:hypothetical protein PVAND_015571 [Polypedilum vanderplanki]|uniref:Uncharacterized protein n=1 Tax=Polypedilum vanderplanki TaxID=319348 RepID=A0A9J6BDJ5_POLVA|nr:hypothetical protein PVAND_015571 [Polypedilum vanderplanki]
MLSTKFFVLLFFTIFCSINSQTLQQNLLKYFNSLYKAYDENPDNLNLVLAYYKKNFLKADRDCMIKKTRIENLPNNYPKEFDDTAIEKNYDKRFEVFRVLTMLCTTNRIWEEFQANIDQEVNLDYAAKIKCFKQALSTYDPSSALLDNFNADFDNENDKVCSDVLKVAYNKNQRDIESTHMVYKSIYNLTICEPETFMPFDYSRLMFLKFIVMANEKFSDEILNAEKEIWIKGIKKYAEIQIDCFMNELKNEFKTL